MLNWIRLTVVVVFLLEISRIQTSCIRNTTCQCSLTRYSLTLNNCSLTSTDLPLLDVKVTSKLTRLIARNAFHQWPSQLCQYPNLQILDLSGSYFDSQSIDFSCLKYLIHLNLSNTQLKSLPTFPFNSSQHLQILDLSNNHIKLLDLTHFQSLTNLISLFVQNNPIEIIDHFQLILLLKSLQSSNFISANLDVSLRRRLTLQEWTQIVQNWNHSMKSFTIRMNNIPFQSIIPLPEQLKNLSTESLDIIFKMFMNSTFITLFNTPKCLCNQLRTYQRMFSLVDYKDKYSSNLYESVKCVLYDGITHAKLFDRRTLTDLSCPTLARIAFAAIEPNFASKLDSNIIFLLFFIYSVKVFGSYIVVS